MSRIEVWKGKPSWFAKPLNERKKIFACLADVIKSDLCDDVQQETGPFLIQKTETCILIWASREQGIAASDSVGNGLTEYFEPITYVAATGKLTAKTLADRLLNGG